MGHGHRVARATAVGAIIVATSAQPGGGPEIGVVRYGGVATDETDRVGGHKDASGHRAVICGSVGGAPLRQPHSAHRSPLNPGTQEQPAASVH